MQTNAILIGASYRIQITLPYQSDKANNMCLTFMSHGPILTNLESRKYKKVFLSTTPIIKPDDIKPASSR